MSASRHHRHPRWWSTLYLVASSFLLLVLVCTGMALPPPSGGSIQTKSTSTHLFSSTQPSTPSIAETYDEQENRTSMISPTTDNSTFTANNGDLSASSSGTTHFFPTPNAAVDPKQIISSVSAPARPPRFPILFRTQESLQTATVLILMGITGAVEAYSWRAFNLFPNMMTGHTVKIMSSLASLEFRDTCMIQSVTMLGLYVMGGFLYKILHYYFLGRPNQKSKLSTTSQTSRAVVGGMTIPFLLSDILPSQYQLPLLSLAFGMINALSSDLLGTVTNAVTGHWTKISLGLAERCWWRLTNHHHKSGMESKNSLSGSMHGGISRKFVGYVGSLALDANESGNVLCQDIPADRPTIGYLTGYGLRDCLDYVFPESAKDRRSEVSRAKYSFGQIETTASQKSERERLLNWYLKFHEAEMKSADGDTRSAARRDGKASFLQNR